MNPLRLDIDGINDLAIEVARAVIERNEQTGKIDSPDAGPLAVAAALSDFFEIATALEQDAIVLERDERSEFAAHGLDLLDRLAYQLLVLEVMEQRENMAVIFASLGVWFARRGAQLDNLEGIADGFGRITNGLGDPRELAGMARLMEEVVNAASEQIRLDEDTGNPYRPWRVLNLNAGIAATRSLDPQLIERTFEQLGRRLPRDMPGFVADGRRQVLVQDVPQAVRDVFERYAARWPGAQPH